MPIGTAVHERTFALCESLNYREWSGYYAVSAYEGHHEHEYNAIRNAAALIDVSPLFKYLVTRRRRGALRRPPDHPRRHEDGRRAGVLHAVVRRARAGHRRWDGVAAGGAYLPLDLRRPEPALVPPERRRLRRGDRGHLRGVCGAVAAGADVGAAAARSVGRRHRSPEVLPRDQRIDRRRQGGRLAHGIHRRSRIRDLDPGASRRHRVGHADGARPSLRHQAGGDAGARRRPSRSRTAADRRGLLQQQEGDDRRRSGIRRTRWGSAGWSAWTRPASSASRRCARSTGAGTTKQVVGLEIDWPEVEAIYEKLGLAPASRRDRLARRGAGVSIGPSGRAGDDDDVVARAEAHDRAGDGRRGLTTPTARRCRSR